jgi:hypothetical protein
MITLGDGVLRTIFLGWPRTLIFPISASQVARIISVSHQHPFNFFSLILNEIK